VEKWAGAAGLITGRVELKWRPPAGLNN